MEIYDYNYDYNYMLFIDKKEYIFVKCFLL